MKTEFPILNISPTQWVLVDKTRIPRPKGPYLCFYDGQVNRGGYVFTASDYGGFYKIGEHVPILAAYPKIAGIDLIPERVWEKKPSWESLIRSGSYSDFKSYKFGLKEGYEAAGGYTREQMLKAYHYGLALGWNTDPNEIGNDTPFDEFISSVDNPSPRALVIEVGEDGSLPSENGTIIYTEIIY